MPSEWPSELPEPVSAREYELFAGPYDGQRRTVRDDAEGFAVQPLGGAYLKDGKRPGKLVWRTLRT